MKTLKQAISIFLIMCFIIYITPNIVHYIDVFIGKQTRAERRELESHDKVMKIALIEGSKFNQLYHIDKKTRYEISLIILLSEGVKKSSDYIQDNKLSVIVKIYQIQPNGKTLIINSLNYAWHYVIDARECRIAETECRNSTNNYASIQSYTLSEIKNDLHLSDVKHFDLTPGDYMMEVNIVKLDKTIMPFIPALPIIKLGYISP